MIRYSDELIDEIKNNNDIVDVVSQYVALKRSGRNYFGLCPFHNEKSPSFAVSPDKQIFHCFGCGVGGNVIHFISKIEGLNFRESIELLAEKANITLPKLDSVGDNKTQELKVIIVTSKNKEIDDEILKNIFTIRILTLEDIYIKLIKEKDKVYIQLFDDDIFEEKVELKDFGNINKKDLEVKVNKKIKVFN